MPSTISQWSQTQVQRAQNRQENARRRRLAQLMSAMSGGQGEQSINDRPAGEPLLGSAEEAEREFARRRRAVASIFDVRQPSGALTGEATPSEAARKALSATGESGPVFSSSTTTFGTEEGRGGRKRLVLAGETADWPNAPASAAMRSPGEVVQRGATTAQYTPAGEGTAAKLMMRGRPETEEERAQGIERAGAMQALEDMRRRAIGAAPEGSPEAAARRGRARELTVDQAEAEVRRQVLEATGDAELADRKAREWRASAEGTPPRVGDVARAEGERVAREYQAQEYEATKPWLSKRKTEAQISAAEALARQRAGAEGLTREKMQEQKRQFETREGRMAADAELRRQQEKREYILRQQALKARVEAAQTAADQREAAMEMQREAEAYRRKQIEAKTPAAATVYAQRAALRKVEEAIQRGDAAAAQEALAAIEAFKLPDGRSLADLDDAEAGAYMDYLDSLVEGLEEEFQAEHPPDPFEEWIMQRLQQP